MISPRPYTQLFMLMSVDGKISTGEGDDFDFDEELPRVAGDVAAGLCQYYSAEQETELWSLNTGRVMMKVYSNQERDWRGSVVPITLVVLDNSHLSFACLSFLTQKYGYVIVATSLHEHPFEDAGLCPFIHYKAGDLPGLLAQLKVFGCDRLTVQSGGTVNAELFKQGLIDRVDLYVAPLIVGGARTPTLCDGTGLQDVLHLDELPSLKLIGAEALEHSYVHLSYDVEHKVKSETQASTTGTIHKLNLG